MNEFFFTIENNFSLKKEMDINYINFYLDKILEENIKSNINLQKILEIFHFSNFLDEYKNDLNQEKIFKYKEKIINLLPSISKNLILNTENIDLNSFIYKLLEDKNVQNSKNLFRKVINNFFETFEYLHLNEFLYFSFKNKSLKLDYDTFNVFLEILKKEFNFSKNIDLMNIVSERFSRFLDKIENSNFLSPEIVKLFMSKKINNHLVDNLDSYLKKDEFVKKILYNYERECNNLIYNYNYPVYPLIDDLLKFNEKIKENRLDSYPYSSKIIHKIYHLILKLIKNVNKNEQFYGFGDQMKLQRNVILNILNDKYFYLYESKNFRIKFLEEQVWENFLDENLIKNIDDIEIKKIAEQILYNNLSFTAKIKKTFKI